MTLPTLLVNDIHARLNPTHVARIFEPADTEEVVKIVRAAKEAGASLSVCGGRHAMGGQQFSSGAWLVDLRRLTALHALDEEKGLLTVGAGIDWRTLIEGYLALQGEDAKWGIRQKQTGADALTIGGALAANIHGRGVRLPPMVSDVECFTLVDGEGQLRRCSREENRELFERAIGGYGMFGIMTEVTLRLAPRVQIERKVEVILLDELVRVPEERETEDWLFGDFQFAIDERSPDFLRRGVFSSYRQIAGREPLLPQRELADTDWRQLLYLAHTDRRRAFEQYAGYYLTTNGQRYWSDTHQLTTYVDDYHTEIDTLTGATCPGSEMITEIYVPRAALLPFMRDAADHLRSGSVPVIYGTIRLIERDEETRLAWAREPWACIIFNLHADHSEEGLAKVRAAFTGLIDLAIRHSGSYYLTYHRWATREQVEQCHPRFPEFLEAKARLDPQERFTSDWFRHYRALFKE